MRVPVINLPTVYHIGTLDPSHRGRQYKSSHEGAGLSVSLCPAAWQRIAKLGGNPWQRLTRPDALYLDLGAVEADLYSSITAWAEGEGLVERREIWWSMSWDDEMEDWRAMTCDSREAALAELGIDPEDDVDSQMAEMTEERGEPPGGAWVQARQVFALTAKGDERALGFGRDGDAFAMAAMFWAEDVLRPVMPQVVGVWWASEYDPDTYRAPKAAILPSCVPLMKVSPTEPGRVDADEDLLAAMPQTRLVSPGDFRTPYDFVTDCVSSTAELIGPMVDDWAVEDLDLPEFCNLLGDGDPKKGRSMLDALFPAYKKGGMDIAADWHVRYHASSFDGMPCLFVVHSAIEYVFQRRGLSEAPAYVHDPLPTAVEEAPTPRAVA